MKKVIFDVDGVLLSEKRYFDVSALVVWEWYYSPRYMHLKPERITADLDDETIAALSASDSADALADAAKAQGQRLSALFSDLHQGTPLPAHGVESLCRYCEMSGLCRREYLG